MLTAYNNAAMNVYLIKLPFYNTIEDTVNGPARILLEASSFHVSPYYFVLDTLDPLTKQGRR